MFIPWVFDILGKVSKSKLPFHCFVISVLKIILNFMLFSLNFGVKQRLFVENIVNYKIILNFMLFSLNFLGETKALRGGYSWL